MFPSYRGHRGTQRLGIPAGPAYHFSPNKDAQWSPLSPVNSPFPEFQLQGGGGASPGIFMVDLYSGTLEAELGGGRSSQPLLFFLNPFRVHVEMLGSHEIIFVYSQTLSRGCCKVAWGQSTE